MNRLYYVAASFKPWNLIEFLTQVILVDKHEA